MPVAATSNMHIHITNLLGLAGFVVLWLGLVESTRILLNALRHDPLLGWAVGPLGISTLFVCEPSARFFWLSMTLPAFVSGSVLYLGLFTDFPSPLVIPNGALTIGVTLAFGILLTSLGDWINALLDFRYPLWGEARVLRSIQYLRASWASIHFTPFGRSYLREHFGANPTELLKAL
jgi:hypothetical protein